MDLCFVVDASGSIGKDNFEMMKDILIKLIRHFSVSDYYARICVIKYSNAPRRVFHLHQSQKLGFLRLEQKIRKMRYTKGGTRTGKALAMAYKMFKKSQRKLDGKVLKHDQVCNYIRQSVTFFLLFFVIFNALIERVTATNLDTLTALFAGKFLLITTDLFRDFKKIT